MHASPPTEAFSRIPKIELFPLLYYRVERDKIITELMRTSNTKGRIMRMHKDESGRACVSFPGAKGTLVVRCKTGVTLADLSKAIHSQARPYTAYARGRVRFEETRETLKAAGLV
jgi:hypothetical protein